MLGALLGAGASILGSMFSKKSADKANQQQAAMAEKNIALQKEFAQNGLQWKAEDARKAGIHPLYGIGAQTTSFSPVSVGSSLPDWSGLSDAGQNLGRAIDATRTAPQRVDAYTQTLQGLNLERAGLENELLKSQIASQNANRNPPFPSAVDPFMIPGQTQSGVNGIVVDKPLERTLTSPGTPYSEPGSHPNLGYSANVYGGLDVVPSKDVKDRIEDSPMEWMWWLNNNILPAIQRNGASAIAPPASLYPLKRGHKWEYGMIRGLRQVPYESPEHARFRTWFGY